MTLTGVNGNSYAGVYTSPYYATVNGVSTTVICDDFETESTIGESWQANVNNVASVVAGPTTIAPKFTPTGNYDAVANLATQLLGISPSKSFTYNSNTTNLQVDLSFAIWEIFDPKGVSSYLGSSDSVYQASSYLASQALSQKYYAGEYSNVLIYTPTGCATGGSCVPQEFISVSAPEGSSAAILTADLIFFLPVVLLFRRRPGRTLGR